MQAQDRRIPLASPQTAAPGVLARAVLAELRVWRAALAVPALYAVLASMLLGFLLIAHLPLNYSVDVGVIEDYGADHQFLYGFNTAETDDNGSYRWTADKARIVLPGLGQRPLLLRLHFFPINQEAIERGPQEMHLWNGDTLLATVPVRVQGGNVLLRIPAAHVQGGMLELTIRTHTFVPDNPSDPRSLGTPLDYIAVSAPADTFPVLPDGGAVLLWLLTGLFYWVVVLRALAAVPQARRWVAVFLAPGAGLVVLAAWLDPARWAFGAQPALTVALISYGLVLVLRPAFRVLARRCAVPLDERTLGWLLLIVVVAFSMRFGGRIYPVSMPGDVGFHANRFSEFAWGDVFIFSYHRGFDIPYPPGPYVLVAPLALTGLDLHVLLELVAALLDALSAALVYTIVARAGQVSAAWRQRNQPPAPDIARTALLAAALYVFTAAGFMMTWWSFDTHIYTQFLTLLLITVLNDVGLRALATPARLQNRAPGSFPLWAVAIFVLCVLVFLGHASLLVNSVLLGGLLLLVLWPAAWQGLAWARTISVPLTLAGVGAAVFTALLFYSFYAPLIVGQLQAVSAEGLNEATGRPPVPRERLWNMLWYLGLVAHFGFFPLLLAPVGLLLLPRWGRPALATAALMAGSFLVGLLFAVLPFVTQTTQGTRWLMFMAWAVAVGSAVVLPWLWRRGRAGRVAVLAMSGFVLWNTAYFWLAPMLWRIRPPEPF